MRIGLFTDTYLPTINGIVYVAESLRKHFEDMGHEVYVFCPGSSLRPNRDKDESGLEEDGRIIKFPSIKGVLYEDQDTSFIFSPLVLRRIRNLELDLVHVLTPAQIGLMGVRAANKFGIPLVIQHTTDYYEFVEDYPAALPAAATLIPFHLSVAVSLSKQDLQELIRSYRPQRHAMKWGQDIIEKAITIVYSRADAVISQSRKTTQQLCSWQKHDNYRYAITQMPNGVDAIPPPKNGAVEAFRVQYGIDPKDKLYGFVGRLGKEKNLPILIEALPRILASEPRARLLFVGDFEYREELERMAEESGHGDRVTFTGALPRETLGTVYAALDVFAFPSLKDTQGWVLHEAAHAGLPIVLIDPDLSEVVIDGESGYIAENDADDFAAKVARLLKSPKLRAKFGARSRALARKYTERRQMRKLEKLYKDVIARHEAVTELTDD